MNSVTDPVADHVLHVLRVRTAGAEMRASEALGAVLCPSTTHGDFVDGEVVPGDLPCRDCGAAL